MINAGMRTILAAGCAGGLISCGGGYGYDTLYAPPDATVLRLYASTRVLSAFLLDSYTLEPGSAGWTISPSCAFGSGSMRVTLDGVSLVQRTVLPPGSHSFDVTYSNCLVDGLIGITVNGAASVDYAVTGSGDLTARVAVTSMRSAGSLGYASDLSDVTMDGSGTWAYAPTGTGWTETYTPASGSRLINNVTGRVATFGGGSRSYSYSYGANPTSPPETWVSDEFNSLAVVINGTSYILDGSLSRVYGGSSTSLISASGEVRVTSDGMLVARIYYSASNAISTEVVGRLPLF